MSVREEYSWKTYVHLATRSAALLLLGASVSEG